MRNRDIQLVQTVYENSSSGRWVTFGYVERGGEPYVSIGVADNKQRVSVVVPVQTLSDVEALLDELRYQNQRETSKNLD